MSDFECNNDSSNLNVNHQKSKKICDDIFDAVSNNTDSQNLLSAPELITKDIIENHMTWLDGVEFCGYTGKVCTVDLPPIRNFTGAKFSFFVSDKKIGEFDLFENFEAIKGACSVEDFKKLLLLLDDYLVANGSFYENVDVNKNVIDSCPAFECLKQIVGVSGYVSLHDESNPLSVYFNKNMGTVVSLLEPSIEGTYLFGLKFLS